ncbi:hypothetical protein V6N11_037622 [Hibiscus sabdariffa]|uniref:Uncharacterized protein n=1 Tax=Hibiscus sabdariffa TaxID=183260 RepID=A0ABR2PBU4_9ROSI
MGFHVNRVPGDRSVQRAMDPAVSNLELYSSVGSVDEVPILPTFPDRDGSAATRTTVEFDETLERPTGECTEGIGFVSILVVVAGQDEGGMKRAIAAKGKVVLASSSIKSGKHTAIQVVEENDNSSCILKDNNSRAMYGPIRLATARGTKRTSVAAKPLPQKDVFGKKRGEQSRNPIVVNDWASNLSRSFTAEDKAAASGTSMDTKSPISIANRVTWMNNSSCEKNTMPSQQFLVVSEWEGQHLTRSISIEEDEIVAASSSVVGTSGQMRSGLSWRPPCNGWVKANSDAAADMRAIYGRMRLA